MPQSTYRDQFTKLIDRGYLVQRGDSNTYDFYETPQRATHTEEDDTASGYDFTADAFAAPQAVNNGTAKLEEINRIIKDGGGAKQYTFKTYLEESWKACMDDTDKHLKVADKPAHKGK